MTDDKMTFTERVAFNMFVMTFKFFEIIILYAILSWVLSNAIQISDRELMLFIIVVVIVHD